MLAVWPVALLATSVYDVSISEDVGVPEMRPVWTLNESPVVVMSGDIATDVVLGPRMGTMSSILAPTRKWKGAEALEAPQTEEPGDAGRQIVGDTSLTMIVTEAVAFFPAAFRAVSVYSELFADVGVPVIAPVVLLKLKPVLLTMSGLIPMETTSGLKTGTTGTIIVPSTQLSEVGEMLMLGALAALAPVAAVDSMDTVATRRNLFMDGSGGAEIGARSPRFSPSGRGFGNPSRESVSVETSTSSPGQGDPRVFAEERGHTPRGLHEVLGLEVVPRFREERRRRRGSARPGPLGTRPTGASDRREAAAGARACRRAGDPVGVDLESDAPPFAGQHCRAREARAMRSRRDCIEERMASRFERATKRGRAPRDPRAGHVSWCGAPSHDPLWYGWDEDDDSVPSGAALERLRLPRFGPWVGFRMSLSISAQRRIVLCFSRLAKEWCGGRLPHHFPHHFGVTRRIAWNHRVHDFSKKRAVRDTVKRPFHALTR